MYKMLQQDEPDDYVLATGETYSVRYFVEEAFKRIGKEIVWEGEGVNEKGYDKNSKTLLVDISEKFYRPAEVDLLLGDPTKAKEKLGWEATTKIEDLIGIMLDFDLNLVASETKKH